MDTDGGPQADEADEQGLINDGRLLITDFVHTENTDDTEVRRRTRRVNKIIMNDTRHTIKKGRDTYASRPFTYNIIRYRAMLLQLLPLLPPESYDP